MQIFHVIGLLMFCGFVAVTTVFAADVVPTDIQQPGTQPGEISSLESPNKCDNCHGGYNSAVEPAHNWRGSMMAHAGRDPIFWATLAVAEQDFNGAGDLCLRCHSTGGWLGGRSTPTDGSGLAAGDSDGVECDYCHKVTDTHPGNFEIPGVMNPPFVANDGSEGYYGSGMSSMWGGNDKLGPYADAEPKHQFLMSKFHRSADFCGTCHDVSNPAVGDLAHNSGAQAGADPVTASGVLGGPIESKAAFNNPPYKYGVVERTYSEFKSGQVSSTRVKDYPTLPADLRGGALKAIYDAAAAVGSIDYEDGTPRYYTCQSCHVRPVTGKGANKRGIPARADMPLHDMTGGNYWMPSVIDYLNARGKLRLGGDMAQTTIDAMYDGALRAREQLDLAASLQWTGSDTLKIVNHTGHKLISGYPEGRRMWLNIKFFDSSGILVDEVGEYGPIPVTDPLVAGKTIHSIVDLDDPRNRIYEAHYGMTREWAAQLLGHGYSPDLVLDYDRITGEPEERLGHLAAQEPGETEETFHFVLNNAVIKDNRIPPFGFRYEEARVRNALPVPASQYGGGPVYDYWDEVDIGAMAPEGAVSAQIDLLYQPTSWEYIQFLAHASDGGNAFLADQGLNLLDAWLTAGDSSTRMAAPHVMASTTWGAAPATCEAIAPVLDSATAGSRQVTLAWQTPAQLPAEYTSYQFGLYYDQAGKAQAITDLPWDSGSYTDTALTNGQEYCYKLTAKVTTVEGCTAESAFSNILCAAPSAAGQAVIGVTEPLQTGRWVRSGQGKNAITTFELTDSFAAGDAVVIQGVAGSSESTPSGAVVQVTISSGSSPVATVDPAATDSTGRFEVTWQTQRPEKKGQGGTPAGTYSAAVTDITLDGYSWDGRAGSVNFTLQ